MMNVLVKALPECRPGLGRPLQTNLGRPVPGDHSLAPLPELRRLPSWAIVLALLLSPWLLSPAFCASGSQFYVSTNGSDNNSGAFDSPFATFEGVRGAIRTLKQQSGLPSGGVTVWLRGGLYERTNAFALTSADSGSATAPVTYRGYPGEPVRIHGAKRLEPAWFVPVPTNSVAWLRLDPGARGHVLQLDLPAHGITNFGVLRPRGFGSSSTLAALELFYNHQPMQLARWPDVNENAGASAQTYTNISLRLFGSPVPDVSGTYTNAGLADGVNKYARAGLVNGSQYNLYRLTWVYLGNSYTAWFLTTQASGYPASSVPFWYVYTPGLNDLSPANGAAGTVSFADPARVENGFAYVASTTTATNFICAQDRPRRWTQAEEPWFHGYWQYLWADYHVRAANIDTNSGLVTLATTPGSYGLAPLAPYYALNLLEEIAVPGEWYLNRSTGTLYFWPPSAPSGAEIYVSMLEAPLVSLNAAAYVTFKDLTFEMSRGDLVSIQNGQSNALQRCVLRNAGNCAAKVSGYGSGLDRCEISAPGDDGVVLAGGNRSLLTASGNYVRNCRIHGFSRWTWTYAPAVKLNSGSVGLLVAHNLMYDAPHTAILLEPGNNHVVEYNEIHDVCRWSSDAGAIYTGRDLGARGTVIRYNFLHDIGSSFTGYGTQGIYLDDCISGIRVYGNVLYRIATYAVQNGGGRDNLIENNVMARCGAALNGDARGLGWMMANGGSSNVWWNLQNLPYRGSVWSNAFPGCAAIPTNWSTAVAENWLAPGGCVFSRNLGFSNGTFAAESDQCFQYYRAFTNHLANADPLFVDEPHLDLTLRTNSPAFDLPGFQPIPFKQIGIETNPLVPLSAVHPGNTMELSWPDNGAGMSLWTAASLTPPVTWLALPAPAAANGQFTVNVPVSDNARFYRLVPD